MRAAAYGPPTKRGDDDVAGVAAAEAIRQSGHVGEAVACTACSWQGKTKATGQSTIAGVPGSTRSANGTVTGTRGTETASGSGGVGAAVGGHEPDDVGVRRDGGRVHPGVAGAGAARVGHADVGARR